MWEFRKGNIQNCIQKHLTLNRPLFTVSVWMCACVKVCEGASGPSREGEQGRQKRKERKSGSTRKNKHCRGRTGQLLPSTRQWVKTGPDEAVIGAALTTPPTTRDAHDARDPHALFTPPPPVPSRPHPRRTSHHRRLSKPRRPLHLRCFTLLSLRVVSTACMVVLVYFSSVVFKVYFYIFVVFFFFEDLKFRTYLALFFLF